MKNQKRRSGRLRKAQEVPLIGSEKIQQKNTLAELEKQFPVSKKIK